MQAFLIGVDGLTVFADQPGGISEQEPKLGVVWGRLRRALSVVEGKRVVSALQRELAARARRAFCILDPQPSWAFWGFAVASLRRGRAGASLLTW